MKKITTIIIIALLAGCSSNKGSDQAQDASGNNDTLQVEEAKNDSADVDAVSSATSKANQVSFNGTIELPPQSVVSISSTMGGKVVSTQLLHGQYVSKDAPLVTLENPEFISLQQNYLDAHAQTEYLETEYNRQKSLSDEQAASQKRMQQSKADYLSSKSRMEGAATQLRLLGVNPDNILSKGIQPYMYIKSPISGYAEDVAINAGKYVGAGETMCEIIDKSAPLLKLTTYEKDIIGMKIGDPVQFRVNGMGDQTFTAKIISIGQKVDKLTRSIEVYCRVNGESGKFLSGMYVTARLKKNYAN